MSWLKISKDLKVKKQWKVNTQQARSKMKHVMIESAYLMGAGVWLCSLVSSQWPQCRTFPHCSMSWVLWWKHLSLSDQNPNWHWIQGKLTCCCAIAPCMTRKEVSRGSSTLPWNIQTCYCVIAPCMTHHNIELSRVQLSLFLKCSNLFCAMTSLMMSSVIAPCMTHHNMEFSRAHLYYSLILMMSLVISPCMTHHSWPGPSHFGEVVWPHHFQIHVL